jgi:hypothetical protein
MKDTKEKLDDYSKILIATASINYMSHQLNTVIAQAQQLKVLGLESDFVKKNEDVLFDFKGRIHEIAEDFANFMNECDMTQPIDERLLSPSFEVLNGKDNVEE